MKQRLISLKKGEDDPEKIKGVAQSLSKSKGKFGKQGRPRKAVEEGEKQECIRDGLQPEKRERGRPKGSRRNKPFFRVESNLVALQERMFHPRA